MSERRNSFELLAGSQLFLTPRSRDKLVVWGYLGMVWVRIFLVSLGCLVVAAAACSGSEFSAGGGGSLDGGGGANQGGGRRRMAARRAAKRARTCTPIAARCRTGAAKRSIAAAAQSGANASSVT